jgi:hypothetical protein
MADFKIESDIPLPEPAESEDPSEELDKLVITSDDEDDDYVDEAPDVKIPGKRGRKKRCSNAKHVWHDAGTIEGYEREKCDICHDIFPCLHEAKCWHVDCWEARGKVHPWIVTGVMTPKSHTWRAGVCLYCHNLQDSLGDNDYPCTGLPETELCLAPDD